jgi:hypothetical protein
MVAQLLRSSPDPREITAALATVVTARPFNTRADAAMAPDGATLTIMFPGRLPLWFQSFVCRVMGNTERFWFCAYASFVLGVYPGAILHFGYKTDALFEHEPDRTGLAFTFALRKFGSVGK